MAICQPHSRTTNQILSLGYILFARSQSSLRLVFSVPTGYSISSDTDQFSRHAKLAYCEKNVNKYIKWLTILLTPKYLLSYLVVSCRECQNEASNSYCLNQSIVVLVASIDNTDPDYCSFLCLNVLRLLLE